MRRALLFGLREPSPQKIRAEKQQDGERKKSVHDPFPRGRTEEVDLEGKRLTQTRADLGKPRGEVLQRAGHEYIAEESRRVGAGHETRRVLYADGHDAHGHVSPDEKTDDRGKDTHKRPHRIRRGEET